MRSRGRFSTTRRISRDADAFGPVSSRRREVSLPRFRREVIALLVASRTGGKRLDSAQALRLVIRWDRMVRLRHGQGKPPCNVTDHILRYERDQAVCPCGSPAMQHDPASSRRDKERARCRRCERLGPSRRDPGIDSEEGLILQLQAALKAVRYAEDSGASESTCNRKWKAVFAVQDKLKAYKGGS